MIFQVRQVAAKKEKAYKELKARAQRIKKLDRTMQQLQTQRNLMVITADLGSRGSGADRNPVPA